MICQTLASVEDRLKRLEGTSERFSDLERSVNSLHIELNKLSENSRMIEEKTKEFEKAMESENAELGEGEGVKEKYKENEDEIRA